MENTELKALLEKLQSLEALTKEENDLLATYIAKQDTEVEKATEEKRPVRKVDFSDDGKGRSMVRSIREIVKLPGRLLKDEEKELADFNDDVLIASTILKTDPRNLRMWNQFAESSSALKRAMDSATATEGAEWVPTIVSAQLIEKYRTEAKVASLFYEITMPNNPYVYPYSAGLSASDFYFVGEATSDSPTASPPTTLATSSQTLTAKKFKARVYFSEEFTESSIVPVLPALRTDLIKAMAETVDDVILNGDTTATHQDSNVTDSKDRRKAFNGLRDMCQAGTKVDVGTHTYVLHRSILKKMAKYGLNAKELAIITGPVGINAYRALAEVQTVDKYGPAAFILTGELMKLDGVPIIGSEYIGETLNASGVYDGSVVDNTIQVYVNRRGFMLGNWLPVKLTFKEEGEVDQNQLILRFFKAFQPRWTPSATVLTIGLGYNLPI